MPVIFGMGVGHMSPPFAQPPFRALAAAPETP